MSMRITETREALLCQQPRAFSQRAFLLVVFWCRLDKGTVQALRRVAAIDVPDADNTEPAMGDLLDAMVVGMHMIRSRTLKK